jgi:hypothetical protein
MRPQLQTGHTVTNDIAPIIGDRVSIANESGEVIFEIKANTNGSITVRSGNFVKIDGKVHTNQIVVMPLVSNEIEIHTLEYQP